MSWKIPLKKSLAETLAPTERQTIRGTQRELFLSQQDRHTHAANWTKEMSRHPSVISDLHWKGSSTICECVYVCLGGILEMKVYGLIMIFSNTVSKNHILLHYWKGAMMTFIIIELHCHLIEKLMFYKSCWILIEQYLIKKINGLMGIEEFR